MQKFLQPDSALTRIDASRVVRMAELALVSEATSRWFEDVHVRAKIPCA